MDSTIIHTFHSLTLPALPSVNRVRARLGHRRALAGDSRVGKGLPSGSQQWGFAAAKLPNPDCPAVAVRAASRKDRGYLQVASSAAHTSCHRAKLLRDS